MLSWLFGGAERTLKRVTQRTIIAFNEWGRGEEFVVRDTPDGMVFMDDNTIYRLNPDGTVRGKYYWHTWIRASGDWTLWTLTTQPPKSSEIPPKKTDDESVLLVLNSEEKST